MQVINKLVATVPEGKGVFAIFIIVPQLRVLIVMPDYIMTHELCKDGTVKVIRVKKVITSRDL